MGSGGSEEGFPFDFNMDRNLADFVWQVNGVMAMVWLAALSAVMIENLYSFWGRFRRKRGTAISPLAKARTLPAGRLEKTALGAWDKWKRIDAVLALATQGNLSITLCKKMLQSRDRDIRYHTVLAVSRLQTKESAEFLIDVLHRRMVSGLRIASLLENYPDETIPLLIRASRHTDSTVRLWMLRLLARKKIEALSDIVPCTKDSDPDVRAAAFDCLAAGRETMTHSILEGLKDPVWFVRVHAVRALPRSPEHVQELVRLMTEDSSTLVRTSAEQALLTMINKALPHLEECLKKGSRLTQRVSVRALSDSGMILDVLSDILSTDPAIRRPAENLLALMLSTAIYFGLKHKLALFEEGERENILRFIQAVDPLLYERIHGKKMDGVP